VTNIALPCLILISRYQIAFDTINIKKHFSLDDYIAAAIILDIDIIRLFLILLKIFGSKND
jgi:FtsH-binding integral membrane protein